MAKVNRTALASRNAGMRTESAPRDHLAEYAALRYDYERVTSANRRAVQDAAVDINRRYRRAREDMLAIGRRFIEVKELLPYGLFLDWLEAEFELSDRMARRMMDVARTFADSSLWTRVSKVSDGALYLLAAQSTPDEAREEVARIVDETGKAPTLPEVERIVEAAKAKRVSKLTDEHRAQMGRQILPLEASTPAVTLDTRVQSDLQRTSLQPSDWETVQLPDGRWIAKAWPKQSWATDRYDDEEEALAAALRGEHNQAWHNQWIDFGYLCHYSPRDPQFQIARDTAPLWMLREALEICQRRHATKGVIEALSARIRRLERDERIERQRGRVELASPSDTIDASYSVDGVSGAGTLLRTPSVVEEAPQSDPPNPAPMADSWGKNDFLAAAHRLVKVGQQIQADFKQLGTAMLPQPQVPEPGVPPWPRIEAESEIGPDEAQAIAEVARERIMEEHMRLAREWSVEQGLTFEQWWAMMPKGEMTLANWLTIFETAKRGARYLRDEERVFENRINDVMPALSRLILAIEKWVKS